MGRSLVILAAGLGSRYGGLKQLEGFGPYGETLFEFALYDARQAGFEQAIFVIREEMEADFHQLANQRLPADLPWTTVHQDPTDLPGGPWNFPPRQRPWGTGHAVLAARKTIDGPFAVINGDDFYGPGALGRLAEAMKSAEASPATANAGRPPHPHILLAYALGDTLSPEGGVSRGVCHLDEGGNLKTLEEHTQLQASDPKEEGTSREKGTVEREQVALVQGLNAAGKTVQLTQSTPVSLNLFGFQASFLPALEEGFHRFLEDLARLSEGDFTAARREYYLPTAVTEQIASGQAQVKLAPANSRWTGVTHQDDRPRVVQHLATLTAQGHYPSPLWG